jgi:hypothetical protein
MTRGKRREGDKHSSINFEIPADVKEVFVISCFFRRTSQADVLRAAVDKFIEESREAVQTQGGKIPSQPELW